MAPSRDKGNQKQTPKEIDARKPRSQKELKAARRAKKLAKASKRPTI